MIRRLVSGGQAGVDRAALDAALDAQFPCGGFCPKGRRAEDGRLPERYPLVETPSERYEERTEWNVRESDGTLIIKHGRLTGGTALTIALARRHGKPFFILDVARAVDVEALIEWIESSNVEVLNVAGSRESQRPGIYAEAKRIVDSLLRRVLEKKTARRRGRKVKSGR